jgi:hypothetical protein
VLGSARSLVRSALVVLASLAFAAPSAAQEHASVVLSFRNATGSDCPDEKAFRELVAARLGYDPFIAAASSSSRTLSVDLQRKGPGFVGRMSGSGVAGDGTERTLKAARGECLELVTSMAFAAALAIDPEAAKRPASGPPPPPPGTDPRAPQPSPPSGNQTAASTDPTPTPPPTPSEPDQKRARFRGEAAILAPFGITPAMRGGARLGLGVDVALFSIGAEGAFLFPSSEESIYGDVSAYVLSGSFVPCLNAVPGSRTLVSFCAVGTVGAMNSTASRVSRAAPSTDLFATAGPRLALYGLVSRSFGVGLAAEVPISISRIHLEIDDGGQRRDVWAQGPVGFIGGLTVLLRLE